MKDICSIVMCRDESDILEEWLVHITQWVPHIYVLDGSEGEEFEREQAIFAKFPQVKAVIRDREISTDMTARDGWRHWLLELVRKDQEYDQWIVNGHPDEFYTIPIPDLIAEAEENKCNAISCDVLTFFIHPSQKDTWSFKPGDSIQQKAKYYAWPGYPEERMYINFTDVRFNPNAHMTLTPYWFRKPQTAYDQYWSRYLAGPVMKSYCCRTPDQFLARSKNRIGSGWSVDQKNYHMALDGQIYIGESGTVKLRNDFPAFEVRNTDTDPLPIL